MQVCDGNTADPLTVPAQVETLRTRFGIMEVVFVGDRGMIKRTGKTALVLRFINDVQVMPPHRGS